MSKEIEQAINKLVEEDEPDFDLSTSAEDSQQARPVLERYLITLAVAMDIPEEEAASVVNLLLEHYLSLARDKPMDLIEFYLNEKDPDFLKNELSGMWDLYQRMAR